VAASFKWLGDVGLKKEMISCPQWGSPLAMQSAMFMPTGDNRIIERLFSWSRKIWVMGELFRSRAIETARVSAGSSK
jgi:hypothetical protein